MTIFEEKDQYVISVVDEKNRIIMDFGECRDPEKIPNYNTHVKEAIKKVTREFSLMAIVSEKTKPPKFALTKILKESQLDFINAGVGKTAIVIPPKSILQKMTLQVITKLTGMDISIFSNRDQAEAFLDEKFIKNIL